jgi:hypothetical protein
LIITAPAIPSGTFTQKIIDHGRCSAMKPPTSGPEMPALTHMAPISAW